MDKLNSDTIIITTHTSHTDGTSSSSSTTISTTTMVPPSSPSSRPSPCTALHTNPPWTIPSTVFNTLTVLQEITKESVIGDTDERNDGFQSFKEDIANLSSRFNEFLHLLHQYTDTDTTHSSSVSSSSSTVRPDIDTALTLLLEAMDTLLVVSVPFLSSVTELLVPNYSSSSSSAAALPTELLNHFRNSHNHPFTSKHSMFILNHYSRRDKNGLRRYVGEISDLLFIAELLQSLVRPVWELATYVSKFLSTTITASIPLLTATATSTASSGNPKSPLLHELIKQDTFLHSRIDSFYNSIDAILFTQTIIFLTCNQFILPPGSFKIGTSQPLFRSSISADDARAKYHRKTLDQHKYYVQTCLETFSNCLLTLASMDDLSLAVLFGTNSFMTIHHYIFYPFETLFAALTCVIPDDTPQFTHEWKDDRLRLGDIEVRGTLALALRLAQLPVDCIGKKYIMPTLIGAIELVFAPRNSAFSLVGGRYSAKRYRSLVEYTTTAPEGTVEDGFVIPNDTNRVISTPFQAVFLTGDHRAGVVTKLYMGNLLSSSKFLPVFHQLFLLMNATVDDGIEPEHVRMLRTGLEAFLPIVNRYEELQRLPKSILNETIDLRRPDYRFTILDYPLFFSAVHPESSYMTGILSPTDSENKGAADDHTTASGESLDRTTTGTSSSVYSGTNKYGRSTGFRGTGNKTAPETHYKPEDIPHLLSKCIESTGTKREDMLQTIAKVFEQAHTDVTAKVELTLETSTGTGTAVSSSSSSTTGTSSFGMRNKGPPTITAERIPIIDSALTTLVTIFIPKDMEKDFGMRLKGGFSGAVVTANGTEDSGNTIEIDNPTNSKPSGWAFPILLQDPTNILKLVDHLICALFPEQPVSSYSATAGRPFSINADYPILITEFLYELLILVVHHNMTKTENFSAVTAHDTTVGSSSFHTNMIAWLRSSDASVPSALRTGIPPTLARDEVVQSIVTLLSVRLPKLLARFVPHTGPLPELSTWITSLDPSTDIGASPIIQLFENTAFNASPPTPIRYTVPNEYGRFHPCGSLYALFSHELEYLHTSTSQSFVSSPYNVARTVAFNVIVTTFTRNEMAADMVAPDTMDDGSTNEEEIPTDQSFAVPSFELQSTISDLNLDSVDDKMNSDQPIVTRIPGIVTSSLRILPHPSAIWTVALHNYLYASSVTIDKQQDYIAKCVDRICESMDTDPFLAFTLLVLLRSSLQRMAVSDVWQNSHIASAHVGLTVPLIRKLMEHVVKLTLSSAIVLLPAMFVFLSDGLSSLWRGTPDLSSWVQQQDRTLSLLPPVSTTSATRTYVPYILTPGIIDTAFPTLMYHRLPFVPAGVNPAKDIWSMLVATFIQSSMVVSCASSTDEGTEASSKGSSPLLNLPNDVCPVYFIHTLLLAWIVSNTETLSSSHDTPSNTNNDKPLFRIARAFITPEMRQAQSMDRNLASILPSYVASALCRPAPVRAFQLRRNNTAGTIKDPNGHGSSYLSNIAVPYYGFLQRTFAIGTAASASVSFFLPPTIDTLIDVALAVGFVSVSTNTKASSLAWKRNPLMNHILEWLCALPHLAVNAIMNLQAQHALLHNFAQRLRTTVEAMDRTRKLSSSVSSSTVERFETRAAILVYMMERLIAEYRHRMVIAPGTHLLKTLGTADPSSATDPITPNVPSSSRSSTSSVSSTNSLTSSLPVYLSSLSKVTTMATIGYELLSHTDRVTYQRIEVQGEERCAHKGLMETIKVYDTHRKRSIVPEPTHFIENITLLTKDSVDSTNYGLGFRDLYQQMNEGMNGKFAEEWIENETSIKGFIDTDCTPRSLLGCNLPLYADRYGGLVPWIDPCSGPRKYNGTFPPHEHSLIENTFSVMLKSRRVMDPMYESVSQLSRTPDIPLAVSTRGMGDTVRVYLVPNNVLQTIVWKTMDPTRIGDEHSSVRNPLMNVDTTIFYDPLSLRLRSYDDTGSFMNLPPDTLSTLRQWTTVTKWHLITYRDHDDSSYLPVAPQIAPLTPALSLAPLTNNPVVASIFFRFANDYATVNGKPSVLSETVRNMLGTTLPTLVPMKFVAFRLSADQWGTLITKSIEGLRTNSTGRTFDDVPLASSAVLTTESFMQQVTSASSILYTFPYLIECLISGLRSVTTKEMKHTVDTLIAKGIVQEFVQALPSLLSIGPSERGSVLAYWPTLQTLFAPSAATMRMRILAGIMRFLFLVRRRYTKDTDFFQSLSSGVRQAMNRNALRCLIAISSLPSSAVDAWLASATTHSKMDPWAECGRYLSDASMFAAEYLLWDPVETLDSLNNRNGVSANYLCSCLPADLWTSFSTDSSANDTYDPRILLQDICQAAFQRIPSNAMSHRAATRIRWSILGAFLLAHRDTTFYTQYGYRIQELIMQSFNDKLTMIDPTNDKLKDLLQTTGTFHASTGASRTNKRHGNESGSTINKPTVQATNNLLSINIEPIRTLATLIEKGSNDFPNPETIAWLTNPSFWIEPLLKIVALAITESTLPSSLIPTESGRKQGLLKDEQTIATAPTDPAKDTPPTPLMITNLVIQVLGPALALLETGMRNGKESSVGLPSTAMLQLFTLLLQRVLFPSRGRPLVEDWIAAVSRIPVHQLPVDRADNDDSTDGSGNNEKKTSTASSSSSSSSSSSIPGGIKRSLSDPTKIVFGKKSTNGTGYKTTAPIHTARQRAIQRVEQIFEMACHVAQSLAVRLVPQLSPSVPDIMNPSLTYILQTVQYMQSYLDSEPWIIPSSRYSPRLRPRNIYELKDPLGDIAILNTLREAVKIRNLTIRRILRSSGKQLLLDCGIDVDRLVPVPIEAPVVTGPTVVATNDTPTNGMTNHGTSNPPSITVTSPSVAETQPFSMDEAVRTIVTRIASTRLSELLGASATANDVLRARDYAHSQGIAYWAQQCNLYARMRTIAVNALKHGKVMLDPTATTDPIVTSNATVRIHLLFLAALMDSLLLDDTIWSVPVGTSSNSTSLSVYEQQRLNNFNIIFAVYIDPLNYVTLPSPSSSTVSSGFARQRLADILSRIRVETTDPSVANDTNTYALLCQATLSEAAIAAELYRTTAEDILPRLAEYGSTQTIDKDEILNELSTLRESTYRLLNIHQSSLETKMVTSSSALTTTESTANDTTTVNPASTNGNEDEDEEPPSGFAFLGVNLGRSSSTSRTTASGTVDSKDKSTDSSSKVPSVFAGLQNLANTCYINSAMQQVYAIPDLRRAVLGEDDEEDDVDENEKDTEETNDTTALTNVNVTRTVSNDGDDDEEEEEYEVIRAVAQERYRDALLLLRRQMQLVFSRLRYARILAGADVSDTFSSSKAPPYVPMLSFVGSLDNEPGFFTLGNPLRSQNDACEFLDILIDRVSKVFPGKRKRVGTVSPLTTPSLDNLLGTTLNRNSTNSIATDPFTRTFTGMTRTYRLPTGEPGCCPHSGSHLETFGKLAVDVKGCGTLERSLAKLTAPERLEGENAYQCDDCKMKTVAIRRTLIASLPPVLVIQLKRFEHDRISGIIRKLDDLLLFPPVLDMAPYTVKTFEEQQRTKTRDESGTNDSDTSSVVPLTVTPVDDDETTYELRGVLVHSGSYSGGHYYSFVRPRFDDGGPPSLSWESTLIPSNDPQLATDNAYGDGWLELNDRDVSRWTCSKSSRQSHWFGAGGPGAAAINYGGSSSSSGGGWHRSSTAFLLFYDRIKRRIPLPLLTEEAVVTKTIRKTPSHSATIPAALRRYLADTMNRLARQIMINRGFIGKLLLSVTDNIELYRRTDETVDTNVITTLTQEIVETITRLLFSVAAKVPTIEPLPTISSTSNAAFSSSASAAGENVWLLLNRLEALLAVSTNDPLHRNANCLNALEALSRILLTPGDNGATVAVDYEDKNFSSDSTDSAASTATVPRRSTTDREPGLARMSAIFALAYTRHAAGYYTRIVLHRLLPVILTSLSTLASSLPVFDSVEELETVARLDPLPPTTQPRAPYYYPSTATNDHTLDDYLPSLIPSSFLIGTHRRTELSIGQRAVHALDILIEPLVRSILPAARVMPERQQRRNPYDGKTVVPPEPLQDLAKLFNDLYVLSPRFVPFLCLRHQLPSYVLQGLRHLASAGPSLDAGSWFGICGTLPDNGAVVQMVPPPSVSGLPIDHLTGISERLYLTRDQANVSPTLVDLLSLGLRFYSFTPLPTSFYRGLPLPVPVYRTITHRAFIHNLWRRNNQANHTAGVSILRLLCSLSVPLSVYVCRMAIDENFSGWLDGTMVQNILRNLRSLLTAEGYQPGYGTRALTNPETEGKGNGTEEETEASSTKGSTIRNDYLREDNGWKDRFAALVYAVESSVSTDTDGTDTLPSVYQIPEYLTTPSHKSSMTGTGTDTKNGPDKSNPETVLPNPSVAFFRSTVDEALTQANSGILLNSVVTTNDSNTTFTAIPKVHRYGIVSQLIDLTLVALHDAGHVDPWKPTTTPFIPHHFFGIPPPPPPLPLPGKNDKKTTEATISSGKDSADTVGTGAASTTDGAAMAPPVDDTESPGIAPSVPPPLTIPAANTTDEAPYMALSPGSNNATDDSDHDNRSDVSSVEADTTGSVDGDTGGTATTVAAATDQPSAGSTNVEEPDDSDIREGMFGPLPSNITARLREFKALQDQDKRAVLTTDLAEEQSYTYQALEQVLAAQNEPSPSDSHSAIDYVIACKPKILLDTLKLAFEFASSMNDTLSLNRLGDLVKKFYVPLKNTPTAKASPSTGRRSFSSRGRTGFGTKHTSPVHHRSRSRSSSARKRKPLSATHSGNSTMVMTANPLFPGAGSSSSSIPINYDDNLTRPSVNYEAQILGETFAGAKESKPEYGGFAGVVITEPDDDDTVETETTNAGTATAAAEKRDDVRDLDAALVKSLSEETDDDGTNDAMALFSGSGDEANTTHSTKNSQRTRQKSTPRRHSFSGGSGTSSKSETFSATSGHGSGGGPRKYSDPVVVERRWNYIQSMRSLLRMLVQIFTDIRETMSGTTDPSYTAMLLAQPTSIPSIPTVLHALSWLMDRLSVSLTNLGPVYQRLKSIDDHAKLTEDTKFLQALLKEYLPSWDRPDFYREYVANVGIIFGPGNDGVSTALAETTPTVTPDFDPLLFLSVGDTFLQQSGLAPTRKSGSVTMNLSTSTHYPSASDGSQTGGNSRLKGRSRGQDMFMEDNPLYGHKKRDPGQRSIDEYFSGSKTSSSKGSSSSTAPPLVPPPPLEYPPVMPYESKYATTEGMNMLQSLIFSTYTDESIHALTDTEKHDFVWLLVQRHLGPQSAVLNDKATKGPGESYSITNDNPFELYNSETFNVPEVYPTKQSILDAVQQVREAWDVYRQQKDAHRKYDQAIQKMSNPQGVRGASGGKGTKQHGILDSTIEMVALVQPNRGETVMMFMQKYRKYAQQNIQNALFPGILDFNKDEDDVFAAALFRHHRLLTRSPGPFMQTSLDQTVGDDFVMSEMKLKDMMQDLLNWDTVVGKLRPKAEKAGGETAEWFDYRANFFFEPDRYGMQQRFDRAHMVHFLEIHITIDSIIRLLRGEETPGMESSSFSSSSSEWYDGGEEEMDTDAKIQQYIQELNERSPSTESWLHHIGLTIPKKGSSLSHSQFFIPEDKLKNTYFPPPKGFFLVSDVVFRSPGAQHMLQLIQDTIHQLALERDESSIWQALDITVRRRVAIACLRAGIIQLCRTLNENDYSIENVQLTEMFEELQARLHEEGSLRSLILLPANETFDTAAKNGLNDVSNMVDGVWGAIDDWAYEYQSNGIPEGDDMEEIVSRVFGAMEESKYVHKTMFQLRTWYAASHGNEEENGAGRNSGRSVLSLSRVQPPTIPEENSSDDNEGEDDNGSNGTTDNGKNTTKDDGKGSSMYRTKRKSIDNGNDSATGKSKPFPNHSFRFGRSNVTVSSATDTDHTLPERYQNLFKNEFYPWIPLGMMKILPLVVDRLPSSDHGLDEDDRLAYVTTCFLRWAEDINGSTYKHLLTSNFRFAQPKGNAFFERIIVAFLNSIFRRKVVIKFDTPFGHVRPELISSVHLRIDMEEEPVGEVYVGDNRPNNFLFPTALTVTEIQEMVEEGNTVLEYCKNIVPRFTLPSSPNSLFQFNDNGSNGSSTESNGDSKESTTAGSYKRRSLDNDSHDAGSSPMTKVFSSSSSPAAKRSSTGTDSSVKNDDDSYATDFWSLTTHIADRSTLETLLMNQVTLITEMGLGSIVLASSIDKSIPDQIEELSTKAFNLAYIHHGTNSIAFTGSNSSSIKNKRNNGNQHQVSKGVYTSLTDIENLIQRVIERALEGDL